jgi:hypothetical protein
MSFQTQYAYQQYKDLTSYIEKLKYLISEVQSECPWDIVVDHFDKLNKTSYRGLEIQFLNGKHYAHASNKERDDYIELDENLAKALVIEIDEKWC